jgi:uncharacterized protein YndB with AHSA1/START domain
MPGLTVKHRFAASAERVYDAWLDPAKVRRFLFTTATGEIARCELDVRVGGRFSIVDRRNGEEILHEGRYLELNRPTRLVFTLRVPKYSSEEDRVTIEIEPLAQGCELTLTTETPDAWAEDTARGWSTILDVLDAGLPAEAPSCGAGLAQSAKVSQRISVYLAELARTLELHRAMLVLADERSQREDAVYRDLAASYRDVASRLENTASRMAAQRELPLGAHDESRWTDEHMKSFARFVHEQGALASLLHAATEQDEQMLAAMQKSE